MPGAGRRAFLHEKDVADKYSKLIPKVLNLAEKAKHKFPEILSETHIKVFSERIKGNSISVTAKNLRLSSSKVKKYWSSTLELVSSLDKSLINKILELREKKLSKELILEKVNERKRIWAKEQRKLAKECSPFIKKLYSNNPLDIQEAIIGITVRGYRGEINKFIELINYPVSYVSKEAIWALGEFKVARAAPILISKLKNINQLEVDFISSILNALGKIGTSEAKEILTLYTKNKDILIRKCAKAALNLSDFIPVYEKK